MLTRLLGAVLAGGRSRRFGSDKAAALLDGHSLLDHVVASLAPQVDAVLVCGRAHPSLPCVPDRPAPDLGPLGGLAAALHHAERHGFDFVLSVPCDTPVLPAGLAEHLLACGAPCFLPDLPVIGLWPASLSSAIDRFVAQDPRRAMRGWATAAGARACSGGMAPPNINTPADLARLQAG